MKTMFTLGLPSTFDFWNRDQLAGSLLGQSATWAPTGSLTAEQRATVIAQFKDTMAKALEVDTWIHSGVDQQAVMQDWYDDFRRNVDYAAMMGDDAYPMYQRLLSDNAEDWYIIGTEAWKVDDFLVAVDQAYKIYLMKVKGATFPLPNSVPTAPITTPGAPVVPPNSSAPSKPATAPTAAVPRAPSSGIIPSSKILGIPTNTLLVGGGVAVGLGLLLYALA